jgi:hypothetical protein
VRKLEASLTLARGMYSSYGCSVVIEGSVNAEVVQYCAATLEPFDTSITKEFRTVIRENPDELAIDSNLSSWNEPESSAAMNDDWDEEVSNIFVTTLRYTLV